MDAYDIAIIGSGFGGTLLAMVARRLGLSVLLLEKGSHPRFAIGESTSPLANVLLEQLSRRYDLPRLLPLTSYGPWQRTYPNLTCGLKRGFTFFHHQAERRYQAGPDRSNQLLVAASPSDAVADTHWLRADVDAFLAGEAVAAGAEYRDRVTLFAPEREADGTTRLSGERQGQPFSAGTRLLIDATGPRGFLCRTWGLPEATFADYPPTQSLYSHFTGVRRCDGMGEFGAGPGSPYPMDDAAVHHIIDGGWMWVLRFGNGVTSAGVAVTDPLAQGLGLADGEPAWRRFLARFPSIGAQFRDASPVRGFIHVPRLAYRSAVAVGAGWALLPSSAAFVDPLFSTGIPLTLLGIERLGRILEQSWGRDDLTARLGEYGETTLAEADATADFLGACYAAMPHFQVFASLSMFYFAAASFSEMARRLEKPYLVRRFLASDHSQFGAQLRQATDRVRRQTGAWTSDAAASFATQVREGIAALNVAGLCDGRKRNWYGVSLEDLVTGTEKLDMTPSEMRHIIETAPWAQAS